MCHFSTELLYTNITSPYQKLLRLADLFKNCEELRDTDELAILHMKSHYNTCTQMPVTNISTRACISVALQFEKLSPKNNVFCVKLSKTALETYAVP
jgi:hypothetical protein